MSIESAREHLMYCMDNLESAAKNRYYEDGQDLIDRITVDLEDIEFEIDRCRDALRDYEEALENESEEDEDEE